MDYTIKSLLFVVFGVLLLLAPPGICQTKVDTFDRYVVARDRSGEKWRLSVIDLQTRTIETRVLDYVPLGPLCFENGIVAIDRKGWFSSYGYALNEKESGPIDVRGVIAFVHRYSDKGHFVAVVSDPKNGEMQTWIVYLHWRGQTIVEERRIKAPFFGHVVSGGSALWLVDETRSFKLQTEKASQ